MDEDTLIEVDSRQYINPQKGLDERLAFIDTLRDVQAQNTAQINRNTYNLGSPVASNVGGLGGSENLWEAQYQTPQTNAQIADLKAVAQQNALNQAMQNLSDIYQNRYKQASRAYAARNNAAVAGTGSGDEENVIFDDGSDTVARVNKLSEAARVSLNKIANTNKNTTSGIMLWEGYKPNLTYAQNMFNYMSHLAQTKGASNTNTKTSNTVTHNNSLTNGGL